MNTIKTIGVIFFLSICLFSSCNEWNKNARELSPQAPNSLSVEEAKKWFDIESKKWGANARTQKMPYNYDKEIIWPEAATLKMDDGREVVVVSLSSNNAPVAVLRKNKIEKKVDNKRRDFKADVMSSMLIYKDKSGKMQAEITTLIPDDDFYEKKRQRLKDYSGLILVTDFNDEFIRGFRYDKGKASGNVSLGRSKTKKNARPNEQILCDYIDWISCAYVQGANEVYCQYTHTDPVYCEVDLSGGGSLSGTQYLTTAGGGGLGFMNGGFISFNLWTPQPWNPIVHLHDFLKCFQTNNDDYTYEITVYVDQPSSGTSSSYSIVANSFNVGHAFIGFKKINKSSNAAIERVFGFYPVQSDAALLGTMGVIKTNEQSDYEVSITYQVNRSQMNQAYNAAISNMSHQYVLDEYNCTNYVRSVCNSVSGIYLPSANRRIQINNTDLFIQSPGRLGQELRAMQSSGNPGIRSSYESLTAPARQGDCPN